MEFISAERDFAASIILAAEETKRGPWVQPWMMILAIDWVKQKASLRLCRVRYWIPILWGIATSSISSVYGLTLSAERTELTSQRLFLEGDVHLTFENCLGKANALLIQPHLIRGQQVLLTSSRAAIWANRLWLFSNGDISAEQVEVFPCLCAHDKPLLSFHARSATASSDRKRLHLSWPSLRINGWTLIKIPYWVLPLKPGVSGLLLPEVGFSDRDGIRFRQGAYWAVTRTFDWTLAMGWIQTRGGQMDTILRKWGRQFDFEIHSKGLQDQEDFRGEVEGRMHLQGRHWSMGITGLAVSDALFLADMQHLPEEFYRPFLRNRLWGFANLAGVNVNLVGDLFQDLTGRNLETPRAVGRIGGQLSMMPLRLVGPIFFAFDGSWSHWLSSASSQNEPRGIPLGAFFDLKQGGIAPFTSSMALPAVIDGEVPGNALLRAQVGLDQPIGPLLFTSRGTYLFYAQWTGEPFSNQLGLLDIELSLPAARNWQSDQARMRHVIEPLMAVHWMGGEKTNATTSVFDLINGMYVSLGVRSGLWIRPRNQQAKRIISLDTRVDLPLQQTSFSEQVSPLLGGAVNISPHGHTSAHIGLMFDPRENRLAKGESSLCLHYNGFLPCSGYIHYRARALWELAEGLEARTPLFPLALNAKLNENTDFLFASVLFRHRLFDFNGRVAFNPLARSFLYGTYALHFWVGCGCYRIGLQGSARSGQAVPDFILQITLSQDATQNMCNVNL